jgi:hypothetical protein
MEEELVFGRIGVLVLGAGEEVSDGRSRLLRFTLSVTLRAGLSDVQERL